jgi:sulfite exporter TauE/SafE
MKKIALTLILIMIGSWCVFAEDDSSLLDSMDPEVAGIVAAVVGVVVVVAAIALLFKGDFAGAGSWLDRLSDDGTDSFNSIITAKENHPILKYTMLGVNTNKDSVFIGTRFAW